LIRVSLKNRVMHKRKSVNKKKTEDEI